MLERQTIRYIATVRKRGRALVAMVRVSGVLLGIGMLMLAGCSIGHGPTLTNTLDVNLDLVVRHADVITFPDGEIKKNFNFILKPGMVLHVGQADWKNNPYTPIPIKELVIKEAGRVLHQFNAEEVRLLIEKQERDGGLWCIERETVYLVQAYKYNKNPDTRERCSKGKPFVT